MRRVRSSRGLAAFILGAVTLPVAWDIATQAAVEAAACGDQPGVTVSGQVTANGIGYGPTNVELRGDFLGPSAPSVAGFSFDMTTSDSQGRYAFCMRPEGLETIQSYFFNALQVVASSDLGDGPDEGAIPDYGDTPSSRTPLVTELGSNVTLDVAMQPPTVFGTLPGPGSVMISQPSGGGMAFVRGLAIANASGLFAAAADLTDGATYDLDADVVSDTYEGRRMPSATTFTYDAATSPNEVGGTLVFERPNLEFRAVHPDDAPLSPYTFAEVTEVSDTCPEDVEMGSLAPECLVSVSNDDYGFFTSVSATPSKNWRIMVNPVNTDLYPAASALVSISGDGTVTTVSGPVTLDDNGDPLITVNRGEIEFALRAGDSTGPSAQGVTFESQVWGRRDDGMGLVSNFVFDQHTPRRIGTDANGDDRYGWSPPRSGIYRLTMKPNASDALGLASTTRIFEVTVSASGEVTGAASCTASPPGPNPPPPTCDGDLSSSATSAVVAAGKPAYVVAMDYANVVGLVRDSNGQPIPRAWVHINQLSEFGSLPVDGFDGVSTDRNGRFAVNLPNSTGSTARFEISVQPPWEMRDSFATRRLEIELNADASTATFQGSPLPVPWVIELRQPNVEIAVTKPDGSSARWAGLRLEAPGDGDMYRDVGWTNTDSEGLARMYQEPGTWLRVTAMVWGDASVVETTRYVVVTASGDSCILETAPVSATCGAASTTSPLALVLAEPNLKGRVTGPGFTGGAFAFIEAQTWNGSYWDWAGVWTQTNWTDGRFGLSLSEGNYRISAQPDPDSGLARTTVDINVSSQGWCLIDVDDYDAPIGVCTTTPSPGEFPVVLKGSNLSGTVAFSDGNPVNRGWVQVSYTDGFFENYLPGTGINRGAYALRLDPQPASSATNYKVKIYPDPNADPLGHVPAEIYIRADSSTGSTQLCEIVSVDSTTCLSDAVEDLGRGSTLSFGNVTGRVTTSANTPLSDGWVSVQRLNTSPDGFTWWEHVPIHANLSRSGTFGLDLEANETYRLTATPRSSTAGSPGYATVTVDPATTSANPATVAIVLPSANLVGEIRDASGPVANAWVGLERQVTGGGGSSWWQYAGTSAATDQAGRFSIRVGDEVDNDGTYVYRVTVDPPWGGSSAERSRFSSSSYTVVRSGSGSSVTINGSASVSATLNFPAPNVTVTVSAGGQPVGSVWLHAERWNGAWWESAEAGGSTRRNGVGALNIDTSLGTGDYRIVVNPPYERSDLFRFSHVLTNFDPSTATTAAVTFPTASVTGTVYRTSASATPVRWAWIEVVGSDLGTSTNQDGTFGLVLDDGSHRLRFHPDYSSGTPTAPVEVDVTVSAQTLASWRYAFQDPSINNCAGTCTITTSLDVQPPNITLDLRTLVPAGHATVSAFATFGTTASAPELVGKGTLLQSWIPPGTYDIRVVMTSFADGDLSPTVTTGYACGNSPGDPAPTVTFTTTVCGGW